MAGSPMPVNVQLDLNSLPLLNLLAEPLSSDPTPGAGNVGKLFRNTTTGHLRFIRDASTIVTIDIAGLIANADIAAGAAIAMSKLAVDPTDRANHTGAETADLPMGGHKVTGAADGTVSTDLATLGQVNTLLSAVANGQDWKNSVLVAADSNVTISAPGATVDGVTMSGASNTRVLLTGQTAGAQNGIYDWNGSGVPMTRSSDADASIETTSGMTVPIERGTYADSFGILTTDGAVTLGTTSLTFTFVKGPGSYTGSTYITVSAGSISLIVPLPLAAGGTNSTTAAGARTNLNAPQQGYAADLTALTAGVGLDVTHSLGTLDVTAQVFRKSDGATVWVGLARKDTNTVTVTSDIAVSTGLLRIVVLPKA